jgi:ribose-phosphate pyrophosphokinase
VLSDNAVERIKESVIKEFIITDTIYHPKTKLGSKIKVLTIGDLIAQAIERIHNNQSISVIVD